MGFDDCILDTNLGSKSEQALAELVDKHMWGKDEDAWSELIDNEANRETNEAAVQYNCYSLAFHMLKPQALVVAMGACPFDLGPDLQAKMDSRINQNVRTQVLGVLRAVRSRHRRAAAQLGLELGGHVAGHPLPARP